MHISFYFIAMGKNIAVGIDIGTYHVKVVVGERVKNGERYAPHILGTGYAESKGIHHGYIINANDAVRSISQAVAQAEKASGIKIKKAYLGVGGVSVESVTANGKAVISRADSQITDIDVEAALEDSEQNLPGALSQNRRILHTIPLQYRIDGKDVLGNRPIGMKGTRLEVKTLFILCLEQHLHDLITAIETAGIEVEDVMASPIAASLVTLSKTQKIAGCLLANIGAETVSMVVFENNVPISLQIFPIGSTAITNDIALGLKIPLEEAEQVKLGTLAASVPKKKLEEIIVARLSDIFELIEAHLKKIGRDGLLPAGIVITGGGSGITTVEELAKASLRLPSKIGSLYLAPNGGKGHVIDSTWSVAYGLVIWGFTAREEKSLSNQLFQSTKKSLVQWIKQFLP